MFAAGILAKKYAPNPSGTIAALGALGGAANISTQTISSALGAIEGNAAPLAGGSLSFSPSTYALFARAAAIVGVYGVLGGGVAVSAFTGVMIAMPALIGALAANESARDIITDPEFWDDVKDIGFGDALAKRGVDFGDFGRWIYEGIFDGRISDPILKKCEHNAYGKINRNGKAHKTDPLILNLDSKGLAVLAASSTSARFDHNNDGIATATGWAAVGNGLLVLDRNGNGKIDGGRELFGDNTTLSNGATAAHGYAALADFDSNGDHVIDALDSIFSQLQVWQDFNQNGLSEENELFTMQALGIQSLNLDHVAESKDLGNGNRLTHIGSYTKTDGTTGEMGDAVFAANNLYSRYTETVELTAEQMVAPNLQGIGRLRDLREAAALYSELANALKAYAAADTKQAQLALLADLIAKWSETDPQKTGIANFNLSSELEITSGEGIALTPSQIAALKNGLVLDSETAAEFQAARHKIAILDAFTGEHSETLYFGTQAQARQIIDTINQTYATLSQNIYRGLLFQTRLQPYLNEIGFKLENNEFKLDFSGVQAAFKRVHAENPEKAFVDLSEFLAYGSEGLKQWTEGSVLWAEFYDVAANENRIDNLLTAVGETTLKDLGWKLGTAADDSLNGDSNNNILMGLSGNDKLYGNNGSDTLIGGAGNDYLEGGTQGDTYVFAKGHGQDTVYDYSYATEGDDTVRFTDIASTEVKFRKNSSNLTVFGYNGDDSVTIKDFFSSSYARIEHFEFQDGILSNPDFARFSQMANNLGQAMSVFGVQAVSSENSNAPADLSTKPILTLSPLS